MTEYQNWADLLIRRAEANVPPCALEFIDVKGLAMCAVAEVARIKVRSAEVPAAMSAPHVTAMAYALAEPDGDSAEALVGDLLDAGLTVGELCFDHLAPAARELGEMWERDRLPFSGVTMAAGKLQALLRDLPKAPRQGLFCGAKGAIFAAVPGEDHTLGVAMAADHFRRLGWDISLAPGLAAAELLARIVEDDRDIVGLSCSSLKVLPALRTLVADLRAARPDLRIVLSGHLASREGAKADLPVVDAVVADISEAETVFEALLVAQSDCVDSVLSLPLGSQA